MTGGRAALACRLRSDQTLQLEHGRKKDRRSSCCPPRSNRKEVRGVPRSSFFGVSGSRFLVVSWSSGDRTVPVFPL
ncbi:hypothetical protein EYF80_059802 [Liparis tanakae]|uniref:Uncharacterized protein n=1 Tax=Liparis tanakae TaxID=230148 RepID=A0A4Z2EMR3_9TELE|nr:hypothetical protein EYF80_059802 [Liparis tanakae]